jgi:hypothetical protein
MKIILLNYTRLRKTDIARSKEKCGHEHKWRTIGGEEPEGGGRKQSE